MSQSVVVMASDAGFKMQLGVALRSLASSNAGTVDLAAVLHSGLSKDDRETIGRIVGMALPLEWFDVSEAALPAIKVSSHLSQASLFRLLAAEVLPRDLDQVVYADADVLFRSSIEDLFAIDAAEALVTAVRDAWAPWAGLGGLPWREAELDPAAAYFNAGLMAISLRRWRDEGVARKAIAALDRYRLRLADQDALNIVAHQAWKRVPPRFNAQNGHFYAGDNKVVWAAERQEEIRIAVEQPVMVHFHAGRRRPWEPDCDHPFRDEWLAVLSQTPWAGMSPPPTTRRRRAAATARRRLGRAIRDLTAG